MKKSDPPTTVDSNNLNLWGTLILLSVIGLTAMAIFRKKHELLNSKNY